MTTASNVEDAEEASQVSNSRLASAIADLALGLVQWRIWWVLAFNDIRQRYRRSALGQFWLTISMLVMIAGIGLVYATIFNQAVGSYIPYVGIGLIVWNLLSSLINELAVSFITSDTYLRCYPSSRATVIYRTIARNFLVSAHNFLILPLLFVLFAMPPSPVALLVLPALVLIALNAVWIGMLIGTLCTRFRDLPLIIASIVQLAFFLSPVLYRTSQLQNKLWILAYLNPFASFIEIVRAPLLNELPAAHHYLFVILWTVAGWIIGLLFYARFRGRILYWL
jgi:lipopolysaccharide transport system permease protein